MRLWSISQLTDMIIGNDFGKYFESLGELVPSA